MHKLLTGLAVTVALSVPAGLMAAEQQLVVPAPQDVKQQAKDQEQVYGSQLMTQKERMEHRAQLKAAKTIQEREQIRKAHHEKMQQRAKEKGVALPDMPAKPAGGGMMGPRGGMGPKR
jgi:hypothetical protein